MVNDCSILLLVSVASLAEDLTKGIQAYAEQQWGQSILVDPALDGGKKSLAIHRMTNTKSFDLYDLEITLPVRHNHLVLWSPQNGKIEKYIQQ